MDQEKKGYIDQALGFVSFAAFASPETVPVAIVAQAGQIAFDLAMGAVEQPAYATVGDLEGVEQSILDAINDSAFSTALDNFETEIERDAKVVETCLKMVAARDPDQDSDAKADAWDNYAKTIADRFSGEASPLTLAIAGLAKLGSSSPKDYVVLGAYTLAVETHCAFCTFGETVEWNAAVAKYADACDAVDKYNNGEFMIAHNVWSMAAVGNRGPEPERQTEPAPPDPKVVGPTGPARLAKKNQLTESVAHLKKVLHLYRAAFDKRQASWVARQAKIVVTNQGGQYWYQDTAAPGQPTVGPLSQDDFDDAFDALIGTEYAKIFTGGPPITVESTDEKANTTYTLIDLSPVAEKDLKDLESILKDWQDALAEVNKDAA